MKPARLGLKIQEFRELAGYTQERLAEAVGLSPRQLQRIEGGKSDSKVKSLARIASVLGVPLVSFFNDESAKGPMPAMMLGAKGAKSGIKLQKGTRNKAAAQMARELSTNFENLNLKNYSPEDLAAGLEFCARFSDLPRDNQLLMMALGFENTAYLSLISPEFLVQLGQLLSSSKK